MVTIALLRSREFDGHNLSQGQSSDSYYETALAVRCYLRWALSSTAEKRIKSRLKHS
ncbi:hypothetical protein PILCRDRAFT_816761 [Piloderma croceum F 1598]|uniref:Uncharacterized protein n=1 Tax=Piloderma croceum (strain F 1598) TaxID=765440 RepID=A0A0C3G098_PILCF|nr:hypothetical protein PILCRDRAFT_816761 [Piloderma croceum F 1598]